MRLNILTLLGVLIVLLVAAPAGAKKNKKLDEPPGITFDGLARVDSPNVAAVYIKQGIDLSRYDKVAILEAPVSFKKGWEQRQRASINRVSPKEIEQIKTRLSELFREVFVEVLQADDGYPVVDEMGENVLLLRPAIIDLDIAVPDTAHRPRGRTISSSSSSATLHLEFYDSVSGEILARVVDRKSPRNDERFRIATRAENTAEVKRALTRWAELLRENLDEIHVRARH